MTIARTVSNVLSEHVTLEIEGIDRLYLNLYVPILQSPRGVGHFWINHRGYQFASSALMAPMTEVFVSSIQQFAKEEGIDVVRFKKRQRKDDVAQDYLARFRQEEGVLFIGKAQESVGQMTYDLRRLRLHSFIERLPKTRRYRVTELGCWTAIFLTRTYNRLLRPGLAVISPNAKPPAPVPFRKALERVDATIQQAWEAQQMAA